MTMNTIQYPPMREPDTTNRLDAVSLFIEDASRYGPITPEQSRALGRAAVAGDARAKEALINHHTAFVASVATSYARKYNAWNIFDEMISDGCLALLQAIKNYDPERAAFITCAAWWVRSRIAERFKPSEKTPPDLLPLDDVQELPDSRSCFSFIESQEFIKETLEPLQEYEREVLLRYVYNQDTYAEIGEFGSRKVTRQFVSLVHTRAVKKLKARYQLAG